MIQTEDSATEHSEAMCEVALLGTDALRMLQGHILPRKSQTSRAEQRGGGHSQIMNLVHSEALTRATILPAVFAVLTAAALLLACSVRSFGAEAYEAVGYLKYTGLNASGEPVVKRVMMFDVRVQTNAWHIRTETVIECQGGIGYFEASGGSNDSVLHMMVTAAGYKPSESPFGSLRTELKESEKEAVYFERDQHGNKNNSAPARAATTNRTDSVASACVYAGRYPPVDPSEIALLWFAFTPPSPQADGAEKMLLQTWDAGHRESRRFWRATWSQFAGPPALVSGAIYHWAGQELRPDGSKASIGTSGAAIAARYEVLESTNCAGVTLPMKFQLTRFVSERPDITHANAPHVRTTVVASVVRVSVGASEGPAQIAFPGKTYVIDQRPSGVQLNGAPISYIRNSNSLPTVQEVKQSGKYRVLPTARSVAAKPRPRWIIMVFLVVSTLVLFVLLWQKRRSR